jgi:hypothetical protein
MIKIDEEKLGFLVVVLFNIRLSTMIKIMNFGIKKYMISNNCPKKIMKNKNLHTQLKYDKCTYAFK